MQDMAHGVQLELPLVGGHGGWREGAGRKRERAPAAVTHRSREDFRPYLPVLVTLKLRDGLPPLRGLPLGRVALDAVVLGAERPGFRLCEYSIQLNHVHLIVEADDVDGLSAGIVGVQVRLARGINRALGRRGSGRSGRRPRNFWSTLFSSSS